MNRTNTALIISLDLSHLRHSAYLNSSRVGCRNLSPNTYVLSACLFETLSPKLLSACLFDHETLYRRRFTYLSHSLRRQNKDPSVFGRVGRQSVTPISSRYQANLIIQSTVAYASRSPWPPTALLFSPRWTSLFPGAHSWADGLGRRSPGSAFLQLALALTCRRSSLARPPTPLTLRLIPGNGRVVGGKWGMNPDDPWPVFDEPGTAAN
jgi:hypothetical protein